MEDSLEGFLKRLKTHFPAVTTFPNEITKDNINDTLYIVPQIGIMTILDVTILFNIKFREPVNVVVRSLLLLGAIASPYFLTFCHNDMLYLYFEFGADPNMRFGISGRSLIDFLYTVGRLSLCTLCIDYGAKIPKDWDKKWKRKRVDIIEYAHLSNRRVQECRESLLALLYVCNISPFGALRQMLSCVADQTWAMRGGEGVGPRGHTWIQKL